MMESDSMTEICLVRHGQTDWNLQFIIQGREDNPLNDTGRKQALDSAKFLSNEKWDVIVSSSLIRAKETAQIIADKVGVSTIHIDERLIERDFGEASGKLIASVIEKVEKREVEGMETDQELVERGMQAIKDIATTFEGKRIIITAHSHTIKAILCGIDSNLFDFKIKLDNACANFVKVENGIFSVEKYNVSDHILLK